ncbi:DUF4329 domain-containing protein [Shewanella benthica]|uniref:DUF4329 domain-containing protein n=1 Tax=Shewanella benthica TaxID=43661 RepID=UPI0022260147|nr:DUF4329 domain-containing protein [Shewanella benthica]
MNNPLSGTDPTGYAASCYEKGFLCTFDEVRPGESVNGAKSCIPGSCGAKNSQRNNGSEKSQSSQKTDVKVNEINSQQRVGEEADGTAGSTDKVTFGKDKYRSKYKTKDSLNLARKLISRDIDEAVKKIRGNYQGEEGLDQLAEDFANAINPISNTYKVEVGANIFFNEDSGAYVIGDVFTDLNSGSIDYSTYSMNLTKNNTLGEHAASIHTHGTHGTYGRGVDNNNFSLGDETFTKPYQFGVPLYMSSSNLQVITPRSSKARVVRETVKQ